MIHILSMKFVKGELLEFKINRRNWQTGRENDPILTGSNLMPKCM